EREGVSSQIGVDELRGAAAPPPTGPAGDEPQPLERQLRVTVEVPRGLRPCAGPDSMVLQDPAEPVRGHSHLLKFLKRADQRLAVAARGGVEPVQVAAVLTQEPRGVLHQGLDLRLPPGEGPVPAGEDLLQLLPGERGIGRELLQTVEAPLHQTGKGPVDHRLPHPGPLEHGQHEELPLAVGRGQINLHAAGCEDRVTRLAGPPRSQVPGDVGRGVFAGRRAPVPARESVRRARPAPARAVSRRPAELLRRVPQAARGRLQQARSLVQRTQGVLKPPRKRHELPPLRSLIDAKSRPPTGAGRLAPALPSVEYHVHPVWFNSIRKRPRACSVVLRASPSRSSPWRAASCFAVSTTDWGPLRLPRAGTGGRYGASLSAGRRSTGTPCSVCRRAPDFLTVTGPPTPR